MSTGFEKMYVFEIYVMVVIFGQINLELLLNPDTNIWTTEIGKKMTRK